MNYNEWMNEWMRTVRSQAAVFCARRWECNGIMVTNDSMTQIVELNL